MYITISSIYVTGFYNDYHQEKTDGKKNDLFQPEKKLKCKFEIFDVLENWSQPVDTVNTCEQYPLNQVTCYLLFASTYFFLHDSKYLCNVATLRILISVHARF